MADLIGVKSFPAKRAILSIGKSLMNASLLTADLNTHLKIVTMGLFAALVIALLAIALH